MTKVPSVAPLPAAASRDLSALLLPVRVASPVARAPALELQTRNPSTYHRHFVVLVKDFVSYSRLNFIDPLL